MLCSTLQAMLLLSRARLVAGCFRYAQVQVLVMVLVLAARLAAAEPASTRELSAEIRATFQTHYLVTDFEAAESALLSLIQKCDASCERQDVAEAWMYIGIVRGGGRQDAEGAKAAFEQALALDPQVALDEQVATPQTLDWFAAVGGKLDAAQLPGKRAEQPAKPDPEAAPRPEEVLRAEAAKAGLVCAPAIEELQTRRAFSVWCQAREQFWRVTLRYLAFNADGWVTSRLNQVGARFEGEIPCSATELPGRLQYFVTVADRQGGLVATLGSLKEPLVVNVSETASAPPPALPGRRPPARCAVKVNCPPDFPGCDDGTPQQQRGDSDLGERCEVSPDCKAGLMCHAGRCAPSPQCDIDSDCESGVCRDRRCEPGSSVERRRPEATSFFGLHFAADLGPVAGTDVCSTQNSDFDCYSTNNQQPYPGPLPQGIALEPGEPGEAYPGSSVGGMARGSLRVLLGYDRVVLPKLSLGGRVGVAFNGGPSRVDEPEFLPLHLEGRVSYWLFGTERRRARPFFYVAGGLAQVDLRKELVVHDCSTQATRRRFQDCLNAEGDFETLQSGLPEVHVTATRKLGRGFVSAGVAVFVPVFGSMGLVPAASAWLMFPEVGFVLQPSLGLMVGF